MNRSDCEGMHEEIQQAPPGAVTPTSTDTAIADNASLSSTGCLGLAKGNTESTESTASSPTTKAAVVLVTKLRPADVIMGRGLSASEYEGNKRLRHMVQNRRQAYVHCHGREGKQTIAREIIKEIQAQGGRFLKRHVVFEQNSDGCHRPKSVWQRVTRLDEMMNKVKQLLRDMAPEVKERRVQRRRRQALWSRQHAYTQLFPDTARHPFSSIPKTDRGTTTAMTTMESLSQLPSSLSSLVSPSNTTNATFQDVFKLPTIGGTGSATLATTPPGGTLDKTPGLSVLDVQMLLVRQYQKEQEQQKQRLHELQQQQRQQLQHLASTASLASTLLRSSITRPPAPSTKLTTALLAQSAHTKNERDLTLVLSDLQRHAVAAPRMPLPYTQATTNATTTHICTNPPQGRLPHRAALNLALAYTTTDLNDSKASAHTLNNNLLGLSTNPTPVVVPSEWNMLSRISHEDLARLVLLGQLKHLHNS